MEFVETLLCDLFRISTKRAYNKQDNDCIYYLLERNQAYPFITPLSVQESLAAYRPTKQTRDLYQYVTELVNEAVEEFSEYAWTK